jgi:hypothetical protein
LATPPRPQPLVKYVLILLGFKASVALEFERAPTLHPGRRATMTSTSTCRKGTPSRRCVLVKAQHTPARPGGVSPLAFPCIGELSTIFLFFCGFQNSECVFLPFFSALISRLTLPLAPSLRSTPPAARGCSARCWWSRSRCPSRTTSSPRRRPRKTSHPRLLSKTRRCVRACT